MYEQEAFLIIVNACDFGEEICREPLAVTHDRQQPSEPDQAQTGAIPSLLASASHVISTKSFR